MKLNPRHVLVASCSHSPFMKKGFVDFLVDTRNRFGCGTFVHAGDEIDHHRISFHDPEPEAMGAREELVRAKKQLKELYKAFPVAKVCLSNHTSRHTRRGANIGIPSEYFKDLRYLLDAPKGWFWNREWIIDGVVYCHGDLVGGGSFPHINYAIKRMRSMVIGHYHTKLGVEYVQTEEKRIFGMCVGAGHDSNVYAFKYAESMQTKPVMGCGVVLDGTEAHVIAMGSK